MSATMLELLQLQVVTLLNQAMEHRGLNRKDLADLLGVTKGRVTQLLSGERNLTLETVSRSFSALGYRVTLSIEPNKEP